MKKHLIAANAIIVAFSLAAPAMAETCQLSNKAEPAMSFAATEKAPRAWKSGDVPGRLTRALRRIGTGKGRDTAGSDHPLDGIEFMCDDWIAICANDDCSHGVVECDGTCIDF